MSNNEKPYWPEWSAFERITKTLRESGYDLSNILITQEEVDDEDDFMDTPWESDRRRGGQSPGIR